MLGTPINVMVVIIVGLQGQPAEGFALIQQPQGQDERKAKAGTMRQEVEAHAMAQITLDLERGGLFFLAGAVRARSSDGHQSIGLDCPFPRMRIM